MRRKRLSAFGVIEITHIHHYIDSCLCIAKRHVCSRMFVRYFFLLAAIEVTITPKIKAPSNTQNAIACWLAISSQDVQPSCWTSGEQVSGSKNPTHQASTPTPATVASMASELFFTLVLLICLRLLLSDFRSDFVHI